MRKYIIAILVVTLLTSIGIFQVNSKLVHNTNIIDEVKLENQSNEIIQQPEPTPEPEYITMQASAYTKSKEEGTYDGITKSGTQVSRGTVAVDPDVIPLGTKLYIENYGLAVAYDTGGAIKNDRIDLYMETKEEAFEFGRKEVKVYILE